MTNETKKTVVELIFQEMLEIQQSGKTLTFDENLLLLEKYKEMEKQQRSIELPSNEEIDEKAFQVPYDNTKDFYNLQFIKGAKWMRDKIQGGEQ